MHQSLEVIRVSYPQRKRKTLGLDASLAVLIDNTGTILQRSAGDRRQPLRKTQCRRDRILLMTKAQGTAGRARNRESLQGRTFTIVGTGFWGDERLDESQACQVHRVSDGNRTMIFGATFLAGHVDVVCRVSLTRAERIPQLNLKACCHADLICFLSTPTTRTPHNQNKLSRYLTIPHTWHLRSWQRSESTPARRSRNSWMT